jgi:hypothetical protein
MKQRAAHADADLGIVRLCCARFDAHRQSLSVAALPASRQAHNR